MIRRGGLFRFWAERQLKLRNCTKKPSARGVVDGITAMTDRRRFLATLAATAAVFPLPLRAAGESRRKLRIGLLADIHKDVIHDADERLAVFVDAMNREKVDAVIQLGDFCQPKPVNQPFLEKFNTLACPKYHVLGNHDMDGGFKREQTVAFMGMKARYYSFDLGGFHFIVLDANDKPEGWKGGYPSHIAADQLAWLKEDLEKTKLNTFVLSHQSFERPACIDNQAEVRAVFEAAKTPDGKRKVAACLNGHWHIDHHRDINGIPYVHVNSASYFWMGGKYKHERLEPELAKKFPYVSYTAPYKDAVFTVLEIDPAAGKFSLSSSKSEWIGLSPAEMKFESKDEELDWVRPEIRSMNGTIA